MRAEVVQMHAPKLTFDPLTFQTETPLSFCSWTNKEHPNFY